MASEIIARQGPLAFGPHLPDDIVLLRTFTYEHEALIAQAALESHGIPSMLKSDSAAGMLAFVHGISIAVRAVDKERAARIISEKV